MTLFFSVYITNSITGIFKNIRIVSFTSVFVLKLYLIFVPGN